MEKCVLCCKETEIKSIDKICNYCLDRLEIIADVNKTPEQRLIDLYAYDELKLRGEVEE